MTAAYMLLVLMFILFGLGVSMMAVARATTARHNVAAVFGVAVTGVAPAISAAGLGIDGHPGWALAVSALAIIFCVWWLHNMAKRD